MNSKTWYWLTMAFIVCFLLVGETAARLHSYAGMWISGGFGFLSVSALCKYIITKEDEQSD